MEQNSIEAITQRLESVEAAVLAYQQVLGLVLEMNPTIRQTLRLNLPTYEQAFLSMTRLNDRQVQMALTLLRVAAADVKDLPPAPQM